MSRIEEIDKIVDEIGDADSLYEFAECVYEDRQRIAELQKQLKNATKQVREEVCEKIKKQIFNHFNVKNMEEYENLSLLDSLFTADTVIDMLDNILKEYQREKEKKMAKKPEIKDCIKFVCDGLDTINDTITSQKDLMHERNKLERARLEWEQETKDRVDISLKEYEQLKRNLEQYKATAEHYKDIFDIMKIAGYIDRIEPSTIRITTMKDPVRLSTRVDVQFESKVFEQYYS